MKIPLEIIKKGGEASFVPRCSTLHTQGPTEQGLRVLHGSVLGFQIRAYPVLKNGYAERYQTIPPYDLEHL